MKGTPRVLAIALCASCCAPPAGAQEPDPPDDAVELDAVEVVGARRPLSGFPGAVTVVDGTALRESQRQVSLAEPLARVPGVMAQERHNFAQDLQVQSRGFGARSTFGIRGIQLVVDGIPATAIDGQGQAANFPLDALDRIEVLRGPLALQYGNAAGGAIVGYSDLDGARASRWQAWTGSDASTRLALRSDGGNDDGSWRWRLHGSHFRTDGARPHSASRRTQLGAVARWEPRADHHVRFVVDSLVQPWTEDPLGLTRRQWEGDPQGVDSAAQRFDTRKRIGNHQAGLRWQWDYAADREAWIAGHAIGRDIVQFLSIPPGAQQAPTSAGGVIDLSRRSAGVTVGHRWQGAHGSLVLGAETGRLEEARRGYENFVADPVTGEHVGVRGRLRRDEDNLVRATDAWLVGDWHPAPAWTLLGAVRRSRLEFASDDHYLAAGNADDSGRLDFGETAWSLGAARAFARGEMFAGVGSGFETPTMTELAYRTDGASGFNRGLRPARFHGAEIGTRWRLDGMDASIAAFRIDGRDEIVPALAEGGRTSYANAGRTRRTGVEASIAGDAGDAWSWLIVGNWIDARFEEPFSDRVVRNGEEDLRTVEAGNRIPGIPTAHGFAELAWHAPGRPLTVALETQLRGSVPVDDDNSEAAPGHARFALALRWRTPERPGWHGFLRVDNLLDGEHVGSVIVNDGNGRHFEPAPPRGFTLGIGWTAGG